MLIFLVDDDEIFNYLHETVIHLYDESITVKAFQTGKELIEFIEISGAAFVAPDYLFLDIRMPEMNGFALMDYLNKTPDLLLKNTKVYMLSSTLDERDLEKTKSYAMVKAFLGKPLTLEMFDEILGTEE